MGEAVENRGLSITRDLIQDTLNQALVSARSTDSEVILDFSQPAINGGRPTTVINGVVLQPIFGETFDWSWSKTVDITDPESRRQDWENSDRAPSGTSGSAYPIPLSSGEGGYGWDPVLAQDLQSDFGPNGAGGDVDSEVVGFWRHHLRRWIWSNALTQE